MAIVAINQGTSGTKALVIGETGEVLSRGYAHLDLEHGAPGVSECAADKCAVDARAVAKRVAASLNEL